MSFFGFSLSNIAHRFLFVQFAILLKGTDSENEKSDKRENDALVVEQESLTPFMNSSPRINWVSHADSIHTI